MGRQAISLRHTKKPCCVVQACVPRLYRNAAGLCCQSPLNVGFRTTSKMSGSRRSTEGNGTCRRPPRPPPSQACDRDVRIGSRACLAPMTCTGSASMSGSACQARSRPADLLAGAPVPPDPNRRVRSTFTPPKRRKFETHAGSALPNVLNFLISHNLTKMAVVQLRRRKWRERGPKQPETAVRVTASGSEVSPRKPKFCAVPAIGRASKKNVPTGRLGGGTGTRVEPSPPRFQ
jgi:hypothetical protein